MQTNNTKNDFLYHRHLPSKAGLVWAVVLVFSYFGLYRLSELFEWSEKTLRFSTLILLIIFILVALFINHWRSAKKI